MQERICSKLQECLVDVIIQRLARETVLKMKQKETIFGPPYCIIRYGAGNWPVIFVRLAQICKWGTGWRPDRSEYLLLEARRFPKCEKLTNERRGRVICAFFLSNTWFLSRLGLCMCVTHTRPYTGCFINSGLLYFFWIFQKRLLGQRWHMSHFKTRKPQNVLKCVFHSAVKS